jgi:hypothetical protein
MRISIKGGIGTSMMGNMIQTVQSWLFSYRHTEMELTYIIQGHFKSLGTVGLALEKYSSQP